jgi:hypothetical protein
MKTHLQLVAFEPVTSDHRLRPLNRGVERHREADD